MLGFKLFHLIKGVIWKLKKIAPPLGHKQKYFVDQLITIPSISNFWMKIAEETFSETELKGWCPCPPNGRWNEVYTRVPFWGCRVWLKLGVTTAMNQSLHEHDDVIKWKHFPRYWPFMRGIHRSPVNSPHKGQWRGAFTFSLICA